ncbi:hypothetical protein LSAT2_003570 [Lamellibrachia satsuma]|nr:hypothetical protein LSAT2_003570 [Lamellibrachia satsuma]
MEVDKYNYLGANVNQRYLSPNKTVIKNMTEKHVIPTDKSLAHERGGSSTTGSTVVKQESTQTLEAPNILASRGEISATQPSVDAVSESNATRKMDSCGDCGNTLVAESDVLAHVCTRADEESSGKQFNFPIKLDKPARSHAGTQPYLCADCGKTYGSSSALTRHQRMHSSDGAYKCSYCDKTFYQSWNLNAHERTHTGEKPYLCLACGKTFTTSSNLVVHNLTHTGEKPHVCSVCGEAFRRIMHLNRHKRVHSGQRPYACDVCEKSFRQKWTLSQHKRTHSTELSYMCPECGQSFKQRAGYNQHNKRYHTPVVLNEPCLLDTVI